MTDDYPPIPALAVGDKVTLSHLILADHLRFYDVFVSIFRRGEVYTVAKVDGDGVAFIKPRTSDEISELFPARMFSKIKES
ncbi:MAG: hypothetical protein K8L97_22360 [Anaerolineae bacterium]|nr:hypothetical protein [Anaerolineae bacterium]